MGETKMIDPKIVAFNNDQIEHLQILQKQVLEFTNKILIAAIEHDRSKWSEIEYSTFVDARTSLRGSKDGKDEAYQRDYRSEAIQHHVQNNPHHPEHWDQKGEPMPVHEVISMFFDWRSRCISKGGSMEDFWSYNLAKLTNQPHAVPIVEALKREYPIVNK
jgi:hypothetical protein